MAKVGIYNGTPDNRTVPMKLQEVELLNGKMELVWEGGKDEVIVNLSTKEIKELADIFIQLGLINLVPNTMNNINSRSSNKKVSLY